MKFRSILIALFFVFICSATSFASIIIVNRTGALKIYMPDGKQLVIQVNDPLPDIPDGAVVTILAGSATINTTGKSTVSVSVGTYTLQIKEDSKINLILNPDGTMSSTIIAGEVLVTRKVEAFQSRRGPNVQEFGDYDGGEKLDVSPSR